MFSFCVGRVLYGFICVVLDSCTDIVSCAKFVLIVEKDATFQRLLDDDFCTKLSPCIIITVCFPFFCYYFFQGFCKCNLFIWMKWGLLLSCINNRCVCVDQGKGVPDVNSRLMVRKLWDTLHIPIFALVDADPHGTQHLSANHFSSYLHITTHLTLFLSPHSHWDGRC